MLAAGPVCAYFCTDGRFVGAWSDCGYLLFLFLVETESESLRCGALMTDEVVDTGACE